MKEAKKGISKVILFYFLGVLILYGVIMVFQTVLGFVIPQMRTNTNVALAVSLILQYAIGFPLMIFLITRLPGKAPEKHPIRVGSFLLYIVIAYAGMVLSNYVGTAIGLIIEALTPGATASTNAVQQLLMANNWVVVLFAVVGAPIMEELIFRKLLVDRMLVYGEGTACVVSGLIFGLFHGNLTQFVYAFVLGMVFAYVYCKYGDIRITMLMHMIINFMGSVVSVWILNKSGYMDFAQQLQEAGNDPQVMMDLMTEHASGLALMGLYFLCIVAIVITGVVLFFVNKRKIVLNPGEIVIPKGQRFNTVILNAGMILFILLSVCIILYSMFADVLLESLSAALGL